MPHSSVAAPAARKFRRTAVASVPVALAVALAGCGQKGGLVLPAAAAPSVPEAARAVEQPAPPPAEPAGAASAPVR